METSDHGVIVSLNAERYIVPWGSVQCARFEDYVDPGPEVFRRVDDLQASGVLKPIEAAAVIAGALEQSDTKPPKKGRAK